MDKNFIEKFKKECENIYIKKGRKKGTECIPDDELAQYYSGLLEDSQAKIIEEHLAECQYCVNTIVKIHKILLNANEDTNNYEVPKELVEKLYSLSHKTKSSIKNK